MTVIDGRALPLRGDDIDTDRIIPARYLRTVTFDGLERHVFEDDRRAGGHPFDDPRFAGARVLLVGRNFGCGSSREHAPQALFRWGIRAIVGESFSDIFFGNAVLIGLPCLTAARAGLDAVMAAVERDPRHAVRVSLETLTCDVMDAGQESTSMRLPVVIPAHAREAFVSGAWDTTGMLLDRFDEVRAVAARLPYVTGFSGSPRA